MPYIALEEHLPGITGLHEYRKASAQPMRELTELLLRGASTLTEGERELIATVVSYHNECKFCTTAHTATADLLFGECVTAEKVKQNIETAPVSEKMKGLLIIANQVQQSEKKVTNESILRVKQAGATDLQIHDTVLIAAPFCLSNRYVDRLSVIVPSDLNFYKCLADRLVNHGY